jgi:hypothetical protein
MANDAPIGPREVQIRVHIRALADLMLPESCFLVREEIEKSLRNSDYVSALAALADTVVVIADEGDINER